MDRTKPECLGMKHLLPQDRYRSEKDCYDCDWGTQCKEEIIKQNDKSNDLLTITIKSCAHCGGKPLISMCGVDFDRKSGALISCSDCGVLMYGDLSVKGYETKPHEYTHNAILNVIDRWNKRV